MPSARAWFRSSLDSRASAPIVARPSPRRDERRLSPVQLLAGGGRPASGVFGRRRARFRSGRGPRTPLDAFPLARPARRSRRRALRPRALGCDDPPGALRGRSVERSARDQRSHRADAVGGAADPRCGPPAARRSGPPSRGECRRSSRARSAIALPPCDRGGDSRKRRGAPKAGLRRRGRGRHGSRRSASLAGGVAGRVAGSLAGRRPTGRPGCGARGCGTEAAPGEPQPAPDRPSHPGPQGGALATRSDRPRPSLRCVAARRRGRRTPRRAETAARPAVGAHGGAGSRAPDPPRRATVLDAGGRAHQGDPGSADRG